MSDVHEHSSELAQHTRFIGRVANIGARTFEMLMPAASAPDQRGTRVGDFVVVESGSLGLLGRVASLKLYNSEFDPNHEGAAVIEQVAVVEMLRSIDFTMHDTYGGVIHSPAIGDVVYVAPPELIQHALRGKRKPEDEHVSLSFASLQNAEETPLTFTPEQIFGRHCAILGATGGGKSWTLARLVEECARFKSKVILLDASGEYSQLTDGVRHLSAGGLSPNEPNSKQVAVPYFHLTEGDLIRIFKPNGTSQAPRLRSAMKSLKLARHVRELAPDGTIIKAFKPRVPFDQAYNEYRKKIDQPLCNFDIALLPRQVENECIDPQRSPTEPNVFGGPNGMELAFCTPMISRISDILSSPNLAVIFNPGSLPSIYNEIHEFLKDESLRVLRISLEYFSFEHDAREIAVNAIGRHLLDLARVGMFRDRPLVVFVDEAHQFLNERLTGQADEFALNGFPLIAKEGRKYCLNLCLATQRPRDIPEGVLSQIGSMIVHRVLNDQDRHVIERACGELDRASSERVPLLTPGEAILIGTDFGLPISVKIQRPKCKPFYQGANYQKAWSGA